MKILVINLLYIGDLVFTTPFIRELYAAFREVEIDYLVDEKYQDVVRHNPFLHKVIPVNRSSFRKNPRRNWEFIKTIRQKRYDMVINLHPNERTTFFTAFSGAKVRAGFAKKGPFALFFTKMMHENDQVHKAEEFLEILNLLKISRSENKGLEVFVDAKTQNEADCLWNEAGLDGKKVVGLNVGSNWLTKRWTKEGYTKLAEELWRNGLVPVFFGGGMDIPLIASITTNLSFQPIAFTGKTTLLHLAALARKCVVFVSGDSGPSHIAASQKTPIVAIFGPTKPDRFGPYMVPHVIVRSSESCLECHLKECPHHRCMNNITANQVFSAIVSLLPAEY